ncbi:MAG TPA: MlaD family protein [archaeon]|nr:MlaD family protein [archaeon]
MKNSRKETIIVGIVVFAAFVIALWTIFYLQGYLARKDMAFYKAYFDDVGLLKVGDDVSVAGVPVGRVQTIELEGKKAVVNFFVDPKLQLTDSTVALIDASDVFGEAYLLLLIHDGPPVAPGSRVKGQLAPGLRDLMKKSVDVVSRTILVLEDASSLIRQIDSILGPKSSLPRTLDNVEVFTANTRDLSEHFDTYGQMLEETMRSLDSAAVGFRNLVEDNSGRVKITVARLEQLSARLDTIVLDMESGRGMMGRLMRDERLYDELRETALEARNLIQEFREHPDKFIRIKAF